MKPSREMETLIGTLALLAVLATSSIAAPTATSVIGDWSGAISTGGSSLRVVIHVTEDKDGALAGTIDSPDQGASGIALNSITFKAPALHFEIQKFGAAYDGTLTQDDSRIAGTWKQGSASLPLDLTRTRR